MISMQLSTLLKCVAVLIGVGVSAYLVARWLHAHTLIRDLLDFDQLFGITVVVLLVGTAVIAFVIRFWPTWNRRLATMIVS